MGAKRQLEYSVRASANLEAIKLYISADNPAAAIEVLENVLSSAEGLADFPLLGHVGRRLGTRELVLSKYPYTIIYRLNLPPDLEKSGQPNTNLGSRASV